MFQINSHERDQIGNVQDHSQIKVFAFAENLIHLSFENGRKLIPGQVGPFFVGLIIKVIDEGKQSRLFNNRCWRLERFGNQRRNGQLVQISLLMRRYWLEIIDKLDVENSAAGRKGFDQLLNGQLVNAALLLAELFVKLVLEITCEVEILDGRPLACFVRVAVKF